MKKMKLVALLLVLAMALSAVLVACPKPEDKGTYTYNNTFATSPTSWSPFTMETSDDSYLQDFLNVGLYGFFFNADKSGYVIEPIMAVEEPIDVTSEYKSVEKWGIPSSATTGYAYKIKLNPDAKWDNGDQINADTWVNSFRMLMDPAAKYRRAADRIDGNVVIKNAKNYLYSGEDSYFSLYAATGNTELSEAELEEYDIFFTLTGTTYFFNNTLKTYYDHASYKPYFTVDGVDQYALLKALENSAGYIPLTAASKAAIIKIAQAFGDDNPNAWQEMAYYKVTIPVTGDDDLGIFKTGEYEFVIVLEKKCVGFYLLYELSTPWIVHEETYKASLSYVNQAVTSAYCTSKATNMGYGPYILAEYQPDKVMKLKRNDDWWGFKLAAYKDQWQATDIVTTCVKEASTRKEMFLKGQIDIYGLQAADFADYRTSEYTYFSPGVATYFFIFSGHKEGLASREALETGVCKQIIAQKNFKQAMAVSFDKEALCAATMPQRFAGFGLVGSSYIWNPLTGDTYRGTDVAKQVLCDFYGVEYGAGKKYATLDEAHDAITGFDPDLAKELFNEAYDEAVAAGYLEAGDIIKIEYSVSTMSDFVTQLLNELNRQVNIALEGSKLQGKVQFVASAPYGNDWAKVIRDGRCDTVLAGWTGGILDPFGLSTTWTGPASSYDAVWYDTLTDPLTLTLEGYNSGNPITMSVRDWSLCLNGEQKTILGVDYNFGYDPENVDNAIRLQILAGIEGRIMQQYNMAPMIEDASAAMKSMKIKYGIEEYVPVMGRGGIQYMTFNYSDAEWTTFVTGQGGTLNYKK